MQKIKFYLITGLLLLSFIVTAFTKGLTPEIIQIKDNRLYFDLGKESLVFPGADIFSINSADTIYMGDIEHSWHGVSVSEQLDLNIVSNINESSLILITPAIVDSQSVIKLGTAITHSLIATEESPKNNQLLFTYQNQTGSQWSDYDSEELDAVITFKQSLNSKGRTVSHDAPFIVVLIPNLSSEYNHNGYLTTSIYNRFDPLRASLFFDGDSIKSVTSFSKPDENKIRPYSFNPQRGRDLFNTISKRPDSLFVYIKDNSLKMLATYLADMLSRDQCQVQFAEYEKDADFSLHYIAIDNENPAICLYESFRLLSNSSSNIQANETLEIIGHHFDALANAIDQNEYFNLLQLIETKMINDLGLFPLFRPTLFIAFNENIIGEPFDEDGYIIGDDIKKIILPIKGEDSR